MNLIETKLHDLAHKKSLSFEQALDLAHAVADRVKQEAAFLEDAADFERAADLYEQAARAFQLAAEKAPHADRERVASLGEFWTAKAEVTRYRVYTTPLPAPTRQRPLTAPLPTGETKPLPPAFKKPGQPKTNPMPVLPPSPTPGESTPSIVIKKPLDAHESQQMVIQTSRPADRVKKPRSKVPAFLHKKPQ